MKRFQRTQAINDILGFACSPPTARVVAPTTINDNLNFEVTTTAGVQVISVFHWIVHLGGVVEKLAAAFNDTLRNGFVWPNNRFVSILPYQGMLIINKNAAPTHGRCKSW